MNHRITRRSFAKAGAAITLGMTARQAECALAGGEACAPAANNLPVLEVRPYQLMCIVCCIGEGRKEDLGDARLTAEIDQRR